MNFYAVSNLLRSTWQLDAVSLHQLLPMFQNLISGVHYETADESPDSINYMLNLKGESVPVDDPDQNVDDAPLIHVLPVHGVMFTNDVECGPRGTKTLAQRLLDADRDPNVIGHIVHFNTPGGQSTAAPELLEAYDKLDKPVVNYIEKRGMCCSAGMYACGSNYTIAGSDDSRVGSIGTMLVWSGRKQKSDANLFGEIEVTIYATKSTKKNEAYEKAINDFDFSVARKKLLDPHNEAFHNTIKKNRPAVTDDHLTGEDFQASEVLGSLVDEIANFQAAIDKILALADFDPYQNTGDQSNQQNVNQQNNTMKYPLLCAALGIASLEMQDGHASLNDEHLQALETALDNSDLQSQIDQLTSDLNQANTDRDDAQATRDQLQSDLDSANEQIANLEQGAGADSANITSDSETVDDDPDAEAKEMEKLAAMSISERLNYLKSKK